MAARDPFIPSSPSLFDIFRSLSGAPLDLYMFNRRPIAPDGSDPAAAPASGAAQPAPAPDSRLFDIVRSLSGAPLNLWMFRSTPVAPDGSAPAAAPTNGAAQPAPAPDPSWRDIWSSLAWAPPNLPLFRPAPTAPDGSAPAAPTARGIAQPAPAWGADDLGARPAVTPVADIPPAYHLPPVAPPVPYLDGNQPYPYMQPFPPAANGGPSQANPPAAKQPAAPIPLPHPRPPQAGPRPQGGLLTPMYPTPKTPKDYDPGNFDPRISPPPLMMPSDGWRRPDLENAWLSPSWSTDVPTTPAPPLLDENGTLERSGMNVPDLLDRTIGQESSANPYEGQDSGNRVYDDRSDDNPHATSSMWRKRDKSQAVPTSALGAGQFLDDTWLGYLKKYQSDVIRNNPWLPASVRSNPNLLTKDQARAAGLMDMRTNYEMAYRATKTLAEENAGRLQRAGVPLTPLNVYIAHFLGANTAIALLQADSSTPAAQVAPKAARSNSILRGRTVGEAISEINHDFMKRRRMPFR